MKDIEDAFWTQWKEIETVYLPYDVELPTLVFYEFVTDHYSDIIAKIVREAEEYPIFQPNRHCSLYGEALPMFEPFAHDCGVVSEI